MTSERGPRSAATYRGYRRALAKAERRASATRGSFRSAWLGVNAQADTKQAKPSRYWPHQGEREKARRKTGVHAAPEQSAAL